MSRSVHYSQQLFLWEIKSYILLNLLSYIISDIFRIDKVILCYKIHLKIILDIDFTSVITKNRNSEQTYFSRRNRTHNSQHNTAGTHDHLNQYHHAVIYTVRSCSQTFYTMTMYKKYSERYSFATSKFDIQFALQLPFNIVQMIEYCNLTLLLGN